jgi:LmbE family N-acetylglucosaminyl deacetylase
MRYYSCLVSGSVFVEAGVLPQNIFVLILTPGQRGIPKGSGIKPDEMGEIRKAETAQAMSALGVQHEVWDYPDTRLHEHFGSLTHALMALLVRESAAQQPFDVVVSFHPEEYTLEVDHPDHNEAGRVARYIATFAAVDGLFEDLPALDKRPELLLWTTAQHLASHEITFSAEVFYKWMGHLRHYVSQFSEADHQVTEENIFVPIFSADDENEELPFRIFMRKIR